ncbi:MAG: T9SS type A sorting domain-containing protein, partial [Melioribacteraceae bacterium]|nr:T9SS type A sorting domain-containing protein [Melioribacteraceae bacterium]
QAPSRAVATAGVYDWAISVRPLEDGTNEIRWYFVKKAAAGKQTDYWFAGIVIDKNPVTDKFNGICFGMNNDVDETLKQVNINDVKVDMGDPLTIPEAPWQAYYVDAWGFVGQRLGGWALTPGDVIGNVTISGSQAPYDFTVLRGAFGESVAPNTKKALIVTGKVEFVGGGFEDWGSLRYGLFNTTNAGKVNTYNVWDGSELNYSGYLFFAPVGRRDPQYWVGQNKYGNIGGIINGIPIYNYGPNDYPISTEYQLPVNAVGRAGIYDFAFSIMPQADGSTEIRHYLIHTNKSYQFSTKVIDKNPVKASDKFNSLVFALGKTSTTKGLKFYDVKVDMGNPITLPIPTSVEQEINSIPTEFSLGQNYPNPFNPTTTIEFALPKKSNVNLIVYDILGGTVASLVNSEMEAGYHKVNFDASNLSSGVYFYSIKAGEFTSVKKLVLMK